jgi:hypothetical protein
MGWKTTASAVVSGMIAFITYVFPTEVGDFLNSIFPNAGYYIVRAVFAVAVIYIVVLAVYEGYKRAKPKPTSGPVVQTVPISDRERQDFRSGIAAETYSILKKFTDPLNHLDIDHDCWSNKAPESRTAILSKEDYLILRSFYDAIDERNRHFALRHGGFNLTQLTPLNQTCVETLSRAYAEVTWLKTESDTDTLLSRARKSVGLPSEIREQPALATATPEFENWEHDVNWRLPSYWQDPRIFRQVNIPGSDTASKLHVKQSGHILEFKYELNSLEPKMSCYLQIGLALGLQSWTPQTPDTIIPSAAVPSAQGAREWNQVPIDEKGSSGERNLRVDIHDLTEKAKPVLKSHGKDRLEAIQLWVNEASPDKDRKDRAVLGSDHILIKRQRKIGA